MKTIQITEHEKFKVELVDSDGNKLLESTLHSPSIKIRRGRAARMRFEVVDTRFADVLIPFTDMSLLR